MSHLEVDDLRVRNALKTHIFQKDVVKATSGQLLVSDSGVVTSLTTNEIKFRIDESSEFSNGDILQIKDKNSYGNIYDEIITLSSAASISGDEYVYSIDTIAAPNNFEEGMTAIRTNGAKVLIAATDGTTNVPYMAFYDSSGDEVVRIGNIDGSPGEIRGYGLYGEHVDLSGKISADDGDIGG
jgi:hypothetical protein